MGLGLGLPSDTVRSTARFMVPTLTAMVAMVSMTVLALVSPPCPLPESSGESNQGSVAQWQALWEKIETEGHQALAPEVATQAALRTAGDTCGMRYRHLFDDLPRSVKHTFQVVAFANDPSAKLRLLEPLTAGGEPRLRQRALLEVARVQVRQNRHQEALQTLAAARGLDAPHPCRADLAFMEGYIHAENGNTGRALKRLWEATRLDPGFWNARQMLVTVLAQRLNEPDLSNGQCLDLTRLLIENLGALPALAQDVKQFRTIADHVVSTTLGGSPATSLVAGLGYQWGGDTVQGRTLFEEGRNAYTTLPPTCRGLIQERLDRLLEATP